MKNASLFILFAAMAFGASNGRAADSMGHGHYDGHDSMMMAPHSDTAMPPTQEKKKGVKALKKTKGPQTTCPVMGSPIDTTLYVDHDGKRIYVCCTACIEPLKKDPEKYLKKMESAGQQPAMIPEKAGQGK